MPPPFATLIDSVLSYTNVIPSNPASESRYLVKPGAAAPWDTHATHVAKWVAVLQFWEFLTPVDGWIVLVEDEQAYYFFDGTDWITAPGVVLSNDPPNDVGTSDSGSLATISRSDHVHGHGVQTDGTLHEEADGSKSGFLSSANFTKLTSVTAGAQPNAVDSVFGRLGPIAAQVGDYDMTQITGAITALQHAAQTDGSLHEGASLTKSGFMTVQHVTDLNSALGGATGVTLSNDDPEGVPNVSYEGVSTQASRSDHLHAMRFSQVPPSSVANNSAGNTAGNNTFVPRLDHKHAHGVLEGDDHHALVIPSAGGSPGTHGFMSDEQAEDLATVIAAPPGLGLSDDLPENTSSIANPGTGTAASRSDHVHRLAFSSGPPVDVGTANAAGTINLPAKLDHVHAHGQLIGGNLHSLAIAGVSTGFMSVFQAQELVDATAKLTTIADNADVSPSISTADPLALGTTAAGSTGDTADAGHVHAHGNQARDTEHGLADPSHHGFMSLADKGKLDGLGFLLGTDPEPLGIANSGSSGKMAYTDHVHAHGDLGGPGLVHDLATTSDPGLMSAQDKVDLAAAGGTQGPVRTLFVGPTAIQAAIVNGSKLGVFVLEYEDAPDWSGYQPPGSNTGGLIITSTRTGRYYFTADFAFLLVGGSGARDLVLEWHVNGVIVRREFLFLSGQAGSRTTMVSNGWLDITVGDTLEVVLGDPTGGGQWNIETGSGHVMLTRLT